MDQAKLLAWGDKVRSLCSARTRAEVADVVIGEMLASAPAGTDGAWPCEAVRHALDHWRSDAMGRGFVTGKRNLRGVTSRGVFDGGGQERTLADAFKRDAQAIVARWPFTAKFLRAIAEGYDQDARWQDDQAQWRDT